MATDRYRILTGLVLATVGLTALAGCSGGGAASTTAPTATGAGGTNALGERDSANLPADWDDIVAAANEEGEVIIYTTLPQEQIGALSTAFNAIYPDITINAVTDSSTAITSRFQTEYEATSAPPADVVHSAAFEALNNANPDWFIDLQDDPSILPSLADYGDRAVTDERPRSAQVAAYPWQLIINTSQVEEADVPDSFEDFADSSYAGQLNVLDPRAGSNVAAFYVAMRDEFGDGFLQDLAANQLNLSPGVPDLSQSVAAGAYPYGFPTNGSGARQVEQAGAPVQRITVDPVVVGGTTLALPADSAHPNAARVFANYLLTAQAQELQCENTGLGSLNELAEGACADVDIPDDAIYASFTPKQEDIDDVVSLLGLSAN